MSAFDVARHEGIRQLPSSRGGRVPNMRLDAVRKTKSKRNTQRARSFAFGLSGTTRVVNRESAAKVLISSSKNWSVAITPRNFQGKEGGEGGGVIAAAWGRYRIIVRVIAGSGADRKEYFGGSTLFR